MDNPLTNLLVGVEEEMKYFYHSKDF